MANTRIKVDLQESYNRQAEERSKGPFEPWKAEERAYFLSILQLQNKQSLLEVGAGHGRDSLFFQENGLYVTAIDLSPVMVSFCRQKGITAFVMDMSELGFEKWSFDSVYALNSLLHLPKDEFPIVLENIYNVLQPGGLFYLGMYGGLDFEGIWDKDSYTPKRFFSLFFDENLKKILSSIFEVVYFRSIPLGADNLPFQSTILRKHPYK